MQALARWLLLGTILAVPGCASIPPATAPSTPETHRQHLATLAKIDQFGLKGRIGVQTETKGFSGSTQWQHTPLQDEIALFSPLGSQVAAIHRTSGSLSLVTSDNKHFEAADAETLTEQNLGWRLPMNGLADWVLGRPGKAPIETVQWDDAGRLVKLRQDGWDIEYGQYTAIGHYQLPTRLTLRHASKLTLKLIVQQWQLP
ncbi:lipoprotein insertase outer membrane protein LolB [Methylobacillus flagellatus]|uniref:Outer-membrane lipoprotein LolB n=1 Tax=Methylobacillus flagellatus (strain ATCC 51484 / DSM 6875 / VKM B-1610 / KT) TaxID=265072 RepID=Q1H3I9_METFK|nr:lipoprotein insertase outer membrane protein LolB [Methylobacillus flagellatus]ABE48948.1 outer membrane lipoprotein LolB [Methylobacillus flagellatus KT]